MGIVSEGRCCRRPKLDISTKNGYDIDICKHCGKWEYL